MIPAQLENLDKTKPLTDEQYALIKELNDHDKAVVMSDFQSEGWSEKDIMRHYVSAHYPKIFYGPGWTLTPPKSKK